MSDVDLSGVKVLIVDDEPDTRDVLKRVLGDCIAGAPRVENGLGHPDAICNSRGYCLFPDVPSHGER